jgi:hypothetical protein
MSRDRTSIWEAKNNLLFNEPLEPDDPLFVDTAKARGDFSRERLYRQLNVDKQGIAHKPPRKQYILFTGHRGCGKSTELRRMAKELHAPAKYYVISLDCLEKLDPNNLKYSDVLLALAAALFARLEEEEGIEMEQVHLSRLENWFKERVEVHSQLKQFAAEVKAGAKAKTGLPWLGWLYGEATNKLGIDSSYREELRLIVRNNFTEFADAFNQLIRASEDKIRAAGKGQRILFTVDGTDRLNSEDARKFFVEDVHQLTQISGLFIYCTPIHLLHQDNCLSANFTEIVRLPMIKIRERDDQQVAKNCRVMRTLALRRVPEYLFDDITTLEYLIQYSGGHLRDLIRLLNIAVNVADEERIDRLAAEKAVKQVANEYRRFISSEDYARLVQIDLHPDAPDDFTDQHSSEMLYNLILLEYNDYFWKSHPVITTLPGYQKAYQQVVS